MSVEPVGDFRAKLGEGPLWDERSARLWWVDPMDSLLLRTDPVAGNTERFELAEACTVPCLTEGSELLLGLPDGFALFDPAAGSTRRIASLPDDPSKVRLNDGECDAGGRFWSGSMSIDFSSNCGNLYRLDPAGELETVFGGIGLSNGLGFSPDDRTLYYTDSLTWRIDQLDFDPATGSASNRRPFVEIAKDVGLPDGMTVDAEGFVWTALFGGSAVHRYAPDGTLDRAVKIPAPAVTSVAFGGADLDELFITTASMKIEAGLLPSITEQPPEAGALFRYRPGVRGRAPHRFGVR
jgi:sugar lactone lactonase YvrE